MTDPAGDAIELAEPIAASPQTCWRALTEPKLVAIWWGSHVKLDARAGGRLEERWSNGERDVLTSGTVRTADPPERLEFDWADDDWPGSTWVSFRFERLGEGRTTELLFSHSGWSIFPQDRRGEIIAAHRSGWQNYLQRFTALCEQLQSTPAGSRATA